MTGIALWADFSPRTRALIIRHACDGDIRLIQKPPSDRRLTIAQALEVTK